MHRGCLDMNNEKLLYFSHLDEEKDDLRYKQVNEDAKRIIEKVAVH